ncbi:MAG: hypothetical protein E7011_02055 [Alphaproteobacteria bacterium]|nr:hypothetical protein [Alphaproteobacteria bacterium]
MFKFPITDCDLSLIADGVTTHIPGLHEIPEASDPQGRHLTRGNGTNEDDLGIVYVEGNGQPIQQAFQFKSTKSMGEYLRKLYREETRIDFVLVNRKNGATRTWANAIFSAEPRQGAVAEGSDSTIITLNIECFRIKDTEPKDE